MKPTSGRSIARIVFIILTLILSACSGSSGSNSPATVTPDKAASTPGTGGEASESPTPRGPITATIARALDATIKFSEGEDIENNIWAKLYKDELDVTTKYAWTAPSDQYTQKMNIAITSGDLPDLFVVNAIQLKQLAEAGQIADLTDSYAEYASDFTKEMMAKYNPNVLDSAKVNGKLMALPVANSSTNSAALLWVRTDWLNKLNLSEPETMQDVLNIAKAFTENDPDGNGKPDTFGIGVDKALWGATPGLNGFFNAYHAYPNIWIQKDGKLEYGSIQPEVKAALEQLAKMYAEKQIDPEFGVKDAAKVGESFASSQIGLAFGLHYMAINPFQAGVDKHPEMEWKAFPVPSIDDQAAIKHAGFPVGSYFVANKNFKHPEVLTQMLNLFLEKGFSPEADVTNYFNGEDGAEIWKYAFTYVLPPDKNAVAQKKIEVALQSKDTSALNAEELNYYNLIVEFHEGDTNNWKWNKVFGPEGSQAILNQYLSEGSIMDDNYYGPPTETMNKYRASLDTLQLTTFTKIIMGDAPISAFDKFVSDWKSLGGDKMTEEVNEWYATHK